MKLEISEQNRGSVMYIWNDLYARTVRVYAKKEEQTGSEKIQMQMETVPPTQILGVYQETGKLADSKEHAHKILHKCTKFDHNVSRKELTQLQHIY